MLEAEGLIESVKLIYTKPLSDKQPPEKYVGLIKNKFKIRYANLKASFIVTFKNRTASFLYIYETKTHSRFNARNFGEQISMKTLK